jgi:hypothetical protein
VKTAGLGFISKKRGALEIPQLHKHVYRGFARLEPFDLINTPFIAQPAIGGETLPSSAKHSLGSICQNLTSSEQWS